MIGRGFLHIEPLVERSYRILSILAEPDFGARDPGTAYGPAPGGPPCATSPRPSDRLRRSAAST